MIRHLWVIAAGTVLFSAQASATGLDLSLSTTGDNNSAVSAPAFSLNDTRLLNKPLQTPAFTNTTTQDLAIIDPLLPAHRVTFGHAYAYSNFLPLPGAVSLGFHLTESADRFQSDEAFFGQTGLSRFSNSNSWLVDYRISRSTSMALIHTQYRYFNSNALDIERKSQTGIFIGTRF